MLEQWNALTLAQKRKAYILAGAALAVVLAVLFAFVTNKIWVFHSRSAGIAALARELAAFVAARVFSGALDVGMMWLFVEVCGLPDMWIKLAGNVVVTILNYIFSKLWIFKK